MPQNIFNLGLKSTKRPINKIFAKKCPKCGALTDRFCLWDGYKNVLLSKKELKKIENKHRLKKNISLFSPFGSDFTRIKKIKGKYYKQVRTGGRRYTCLKCKHTFDK